MSYANGNEIFVGRDYEKQKSYSERTAGDIDGEVADIMRAAYQRCTEILDGSRDQVEQIAAYLLAHDSMSREQFEAAMEGRPIPEGSGSFVFDGDEESKRVVTGQELSDVPEEAPQTVEPDGDTVPGGPPEKT